MSVSKSIARPRWLLAAGVVAGILIFMGMSLFVFARVEEQDVFCTSCHTEPEMTFFARTQAVAAVDMASEHAMYARKDPTLVNTRCIDCHSGAGALGRVQGMVKGAENAVRWVTKTATQPAVMAERLPDANCLQCHAATPKETDFDSHSHFYLAKWQSMDASAGGCVDCHTAHTLHGNAGVGFLNQQRTLEQCDRCHVALGER